VASKKGARPTVAPKASASPRASTPPASAVRVPTAEDLDLARNDALLQLRIGQSAHYYSILVAIAFLFDAALVLYLQPVLGVVEPAQLRSVFFLVFPVIGGIFLAAFGLRVKWETYQLWPWESHFWASILAVVFNVVLVYVYFASLAHVGPTADWSLLPWFYPAVLGGLSLALVGLALTWSEWTQRKTVSVAAAVLPIPFAFVLFFFQSSPQDAVNALALSLSASAALYLIAGGFLHIISSGTRTHEREVITSGQSRVFQVVEEVRRKEEALRFREATLLKREADADDAEDGLRREREALTTAKDQFTRLEADLVTRTESLRQGEQSWAARAAETTTLSHTIQDKEVELQLRERDLEARLPKVSDREAQLIQREADHRRLEVDLLRREQELERRQQGIPEGEADLERRRQEMDRRTAELLRKESELRTREASGGPTPAGAPAGSAGGLEDREARLGQLKITLDEQNLILGRKARQVDESLKDLLRREAELAQREGGLTAREASLTQRESDAKDRFDLGEGRRQQYEEVLQRYETKVRETDTREADLAARRAELERTAASLVQRESQAKEREQQLGLQRTSLDRLQRVLAERQKSLDAQQDEVALRLQTLPRNGVGTAPAMPPASSAAPMPDLLAPPTGKKIAGRLPTGTPRLDDLLQGGLPPKAHALVVGGAFVGKEIVVNAFIAEGLKLGHPVIVVTTSRAPEELAQQVGLVAPQFREYEQLGKVTWIDASRPTSGSGGAAPTAVAATTVVNGPDDHAGILRALVAASKKLEAGGQPYRVAYFGLAASMSHGADRTAMNFLQNFVGILKPRPALAAYTLDAGALPDGQVEQILTRMDGAIRFKQEGDKTFLAVAGFGEVATREWIECRATNRALVVGSFSLERIR
jgi:hypothetical protein